MEKSGSIRHGIERELKTAIFRLGFASDITHHESYKKPPLLSKWFSVSSTKPSLLGETINPI
jgi:hypothetical protein